MPDQPPCWIDDFGPLPVVPAASAAALGDIVRRAAAEGQALYPLGGRTMLGQGLRPTRQGLAVDLRNLAQVIDYPARDMTITVQAGIPLAHLQDQLRQENQRLPIDVPNAGEATLGGALATNTSGPRRLGFGTWRDYVIGISAVNDQGQEIKAGGRVVKNVAGYDLCKLFVGALGTLGIITQVTLKVKPRPEEQALVILPCAADNLEALLDQVHRSRTRPVCCDLLNSAAARSLDPRAGTTLPEAPWVMVLGFEDNCDAVAWQVAQIIRELGAVFGPGLEVRVGGAAASLWSALVEFPAQADTRLTFKANLLPSAIAAFCQQAAALPERLLLQAHAGNGIVLGHAPSDLTLDRAQAMLNLLLAAATQAQGNLVVPHCPSAWKPTLPIWGALRNDNGLMRTIKRTLDPRSLFNPGRFVDGI